MSDQYNVKADIANRTVEIEIPSPLLPHPKVVLPWVVVKGIAAKILEVEVAQEQRAAGAVAIAEPRLVQ